MKKVLVLAVAIFGAVMAQAVSCEWTINYMTTDAQTWENNGALAMVFAGSDMQSVKALIAKNTGSALQSALEEKRLAVGEFTANALGFVSTEYVSFTLPDDNKVFSMIFKDSAFAASTQVLWTDILDGEEEGLYLSNSAFTNNATIAEIQAESSSVPEPGMLALLALGVAGLALKRKVA